MFQIGTSNNEGRGGRRNLPYVFTEHGVAMLSSVLNSERAVKMNILIIRASHLKHEPESFQWLLQQINKPPEVYLFIDDNPRNTQTAQSMGMNAIQFVSATQLAAELRSFAIEL